VNSSDAVISTVPLDEAAMASFAIDTHSSLTVSMFLLLAVAAACLASKSASALSRAVSESPVFI